jgi:hypothetical protein
MSAQISVNDLAAELGLTVRELSIQVSRLCMDQSWGPKNVVAHAVADSGSCLLHGDAADEIRALHSMARAA